MTLQRVIFLFLSLLAAAGLRAQQEADSLSRVLAGHPHEDTTRIRLLNGTAFVLYNVDPGRGVLLSAEAIRLSERFNDRLQLAAAWRNKGLNLYSLGKDSLALDAYNRSLGLERSLNNARGQARTLHALGLLYSGESEYYKAIDYHTQAMSIFRLLDDQNGVANSANSLGTNYLFLSDYAKAIEYYLQGLADYGKSNNEKGIGQEYMNLAIVYRRISNLEKAIEYNNKALACYSKNEDVLAKANVFANLANIYDDMGNGAKALEYYEMALKMNEGIGNKRGIASNCLNKGITYNGQGNYDSSFLYLNRGLALYREIGDKNSMSIALSELGKACRKAPEGVLRKQPSWKGDRYAAAIDYEKKALQLAVDIEAVENQRDIWEYLAQTYEAKGEAGKALDAYKHYIVLKDSVLSDDTRQKIQGLTLQYEHDKKEAVLTAGFNKKQAEAAAALTRQQWITGLVVLTGVVFILAGFISIRFYRRKRETEQLYLVADLEMKALRSQMNPHFIFNSLNSISDYITRHQTEEANDYLIRFSRLMGQILENSEYKEVSLSDDILVMTLYMDLESMRLNHSFRYRIEVDEQIDTEKIVIPPLLLQPFIENSIWHGFSGKTGFEGELLIGIHEKKGMLYCVVEDNGIGRRSSAAKGKGDGRKSFGVKITADRIAMLNKTKNHQASMEVSDLDQGTRVEIWLPLMET